jgi:hypothetical protein
LLSYFNIYGEINDSVVSIFISLFGGGFLVFIVPDDDDDDDVYLDKLQTRGVKESILYV